MCWSVSTCYAKVLDIPEVSLVAILDADKEGFLRSVVSLVQTIGRAARNINGKAILYGDRITRSMQQAIEETERRREKQHQFNIEHHIEPATILKSITDILQIVDSRLRPSFRGQKTQQSGGILGRL